MESTELLQLLPSSIMDDTTLSQSAKKVLAALMLLDGMDYARQHGSFYRSNKDLMNDAGVSEPTLISSLRKLELSGYITRSTGTRKDGASIYTLNRNLYAMDCDFSNHFSNHFSDNFSNHFSNDFSDDFSNNFSNNFSNKMVETQILNELAEIKGLLKILVKNFSNSNGDFSNHFSNDFSTDTDTEEEIEKEKKEKINKKEKVSVETVSEPRNGNGVNTELDDVISSNVKGNTVTVSEETSKGTVKNFGLHTLQELMELVGNSETSEDTLTSSERSDKENTKASNDTLTSSVRTNKDTHNTSKVNTFNKVKNSQSTVDEVNLHNVGSVSEKQEISAPAPAANFNYDFYLNQFEHWAKNGIAAFNIDRFTQTVKPFVDSGEIKIERYQRDVARLQRYA